MPEYDNAAVAAVLEDFSKLLEIAGEDRYRFLSYREAAQSVLAWAERISTTVREGRLTDIPGVGPRLAAAIESLFERGTFAEYEDLTARIPGTLTELTRVPGLGPKRARALWEQRRIATLDDLEDALSSGGLDGLPGFGPKTTAVIADGLARYRELSRRMLLSDAVPLGDDMVAALERVPAVCRASTVGSVRRLRETVGDVTVLVASDHAQAVLDSLPDLPTVTDVRECENDSAVVVAPGDRRVVVRVTPPSTWGAALQQLTGSVRHNHHLRAIASGLGFDLTERGLVRRSDGACVPTPAERDVYEALGMRTMPPEIREDLGEIELALNGKVPDLLEMADIRGDLHFHTTETDGRSTLEQTRARASELGYEYVACSDHAYDLRMVGGLDERQIEEQWERIDELNALGDGPYILKGIELNIDDEGGLDYPDETLAKFDLCLASLHSGFGQSREQATRRVLKAMENPYADIIGHPTGILLGKREPFDLDMEAIIAQAATTGTILELNAHPQRLDLNDEYLRIARVAGVMIAINTDAHDAVQLSHMRWGVATARRGWLSAQDVLNAQPLGVMRSCLKRNGAHR